MKIQSPDGTTWRVRRRWLPWRPRRRRRGERSLRPGALFDGVSDLGSLLLALAFAVVILLAPFVLLPLLVVAELLLLVVVLPLAMVGRIALGRHWTVELRRGWTAWWETDAGDWASSRLRIYEVADAIRRGEVPERTLGVPEEPSATSEA